MTTIVMREQQGGIWRLVTDEPAMINKMGSCLVPANEMQGRPGVFEYFLSPHQVFFRKNQTMRNPALGAIEDDGDAAERATDIALLLAPEPAPWGAMDDDEWSRFLYSDVKWRPPRE